MHGTGGDSGIDLGIPGYENAEFIGGGGFGTVYRAMRPELNQIVAIKILARPATDPDTWRLFDRERRSMGTLSAHPGIVTVFDSGLTAHDRRPYLIMEYLDAGSLADREPMTWQDATQVGASVAGALQTAHDHGVLHRDIKPDNLLASTFGEVKITDFGIALLAEATGSVTTRVVGTVQYMAPELLLPKPGRPSVRTDVYSLAATVMALMLGRPPFGRPDDTLLTIVDEVLKAPIPDLRSHGVPPSVATVIERAMSKRPDDRYSSAAEFEEALSGARAAAGIHGASGAVAIPASTRIVTPALSEMPTDVGAGTQRATGGRRRLPLAWIAAGAATILLMGVVAALAVARLGDDRQAAAAPVSVTSSIALPVTEAPPVTEGPSVSDAPPGTEAPLATEAPAATVNPQRVPPATSPPADPPPPPSVTTTCLLDGAIEGAYRGDSFNLTHDLQGSVTMTIRALGTRDCGAVADLEWSDGLSGSAQVSWVANRGQDLVFAGDFYLRDVPYDIEVSLSDLGNGDMRGSYEIFQKPGGPIDAVGGGIFLASRF